MLLEKYLVVSLREKVGQVKRKPLISRLVDRPLRPLFDSAFTREVQLILTLLSYNPDVDAEITANSSIGMC